MLDAPRVAESAVARRFPRIGDHVASEAKPFPGTGGCLGAGCGWGGLLIRRSASGDSASVACPNWRPKPKPRGFPPLEARPKKGFVSAVAIARLSKVLTTLRTCRALSLTPDISALHQRFVHLLRCIRCTAAGFRNSEGLVRQFDAETSPCGLGAGAPAKFETHVSLCHRDT